MSNDKIIVNISIRDKRAYGDGTIFVCDNSDYVLHFDFDEQWDGVEAKTARIIYSGSKYIDIPFRGNQVKIERTPVSNRYSIGVYASNIKTSTPAFFDCDYSILSTNPFHAPIPEDTYNKIMDLIEGVDDAILEVDELPSEGIDPNTFYRVGDKLYYRVGDKWAEITTDFFDYVKRGEYEEAMQSLTDSLAEINEGVDGKLTAMGESLKANEVKADNHDKRITNIERHISNDYFVTDETTEYNKLVPVDACPYAQVNSFGGMTHKTKNLIPFPYADGDNKTANGVTWTVNADRSITANGTATGVSTFILTKKENFTLPQGTYMLSGCSSGGTVDTYYCVISAYDGNTWITEAIDIGAGRTFNTSGLTYNGVHIVLAVKAGTACNNLVFKPMLNEGSTALPYEPYFEGLRNAKVTEVVSHGANILPSSFTDAFGTIKGITFTDNGDGTLTANGTATADVTFIMTTMTLKGTYSLSGTIGGSKKTYYMAMGSSDYADIGSGISRTYSEELLQNIFIRVVGGATLNNIVFKPMLVKGETALPYEPYREPIHYPIPIEIQELEGYGEGIKGYPNIMDFENREFIPHTSPSPYIFTGEEYIVSYGSGNNGGYCYRVTISANLKNSALNEVTLLADKYTAVKNVGSIKNMSVGTIKECGYGNQIDITSAKATEAEFRQELKGTILYYALNNPLPIDISQYLTDELSGGFIKVQGGGRIEFVNEHDYAVPNSVTYLLKEGSI